MPKPISEVTDQELRNFEENYRRAKKIEGGPYPLSAILLEKLRRKPSPFGVREVAAKILELAAASNDGLKTYGDIWNAFCPDSPWEGHKNLRIVADSLARVIRYCVMNGLPILTVLVVRANNRKLSDGAIQNIYREVKELGVGGTVRK